MADDVPGASWLVDSIYVGGSLPIYSGAANATLTSGKMTDSEARVSAMMHKLRGCILSSNK
jgi:hypothetical protein